MAIITLDGLVAGLKPASAFTKAAFTGKAAGQLHSLLGLTGRPGPCTFAAPRAGRVDRMVRRVAACAAIGCLLAAVASAQQTLVASDNFSNCCAGNEAPLDGRIAADGTLWALSDNTIGSCPVYTAPVNTWGFKVATGKKWISPTCDKVGVRVSFVVIPVGSMSADQELRFRMSSAASGSSISFTYVQLRTTAINTFYGAGWYNRTNPADAYLFKVVGGIYTQLANSDCNIYGHKDYPAQNDIVRFRVLGSSLYLYRLDGMTQVETLCLTASDSEITDAGVVGLGMGNIRSAGDKVEGSLSYDDIEVYNLSGVPPPVPSTFDANGCTPNHGEWLPGQPRPQIPSCPAGVSAIMVTVP